MRVLVLGGTRFLGRHIVRLLLDSGAEVTVAQRGQTGSPPEGAANAYLDRTTGDGLEALRDWRPRAVIDLSGYRSDWVRDAISVFAGSGVRVNYVFVSSGAVYRASEELPWAETTPYGPMPLWGDYGHQKMAAERLLWQAQSEGAVSPCAFRFPFILGPGNYADRESFVCSRILAGRPLLLSGGGTAVNQFIHVVDAAQAVVSAVLQPDRSSGQAFNCAYARGVTNRGFVELCGHVLGEQPQIVSIDERSLGVESEVWDLTNVVFPFPAIHYLLDCTRVQEQLGVQPRRSTRDAIEDFVATWDDAQRDPRHYEREQRALTAIGHPLPEGQT